MAERLCVLCMFRALASMANRGKNKSGRQFVVTYGKASYWRLNWIRTEA
jgi:hypothetical protein